MLRAALVVATLAVVLSFGFGLPVVSAQYYGPSFTLPTAISPGSNIPIVLTTASSSTFVAPPSGSGASCTAGTCSYPLQACPDPAAFYISIHSVTVTDPSGNEYMLGSATTSGLYWPANQGGGGSNNGPATGQANELNITGTQSDTLIFGTGAGGQSFSSEDYVTSAPFTAVSDSAGAYYWWTVAGNSNGANLRLDQNTGIMPTEPHGQYTVDIEGVAVCGTSTTVVNFVVFFDTPVTVITPQFGGSIVAVAGVAFVLLMLARRGMFNKKLSTVSTIQ